MPLVTFSDAVNTKAVEVLLDGVKSFSILLSDLEEPLKEWDRRELQYIKSFAQVTATSSKPRSEIESAIAGLDIPL